MMKFFRRFNDLGISGSFARWYNKNSREHRLEEMKSYAQEAAKNINSGASVLEVAPGPGYLSIELAKLGSYKITGLDISKDFTIIARENAKAAGVEVDFLQGNAAEMIFRDNMFDFIICTAAFKNFKQPGRVLSEFYRVLNPGASALIIDMNPDVSNMQLDDYTNEMNLKGIEALFMKLMFKYFLKKGAHNKNSFKELISKSEFQNYDVREIGICLNVYLRK
jgi:ubiquinone/menaquinone biosynthesis C-methylase UbiE